MAAATMNANSGLDKDTGLKYAESMLWLTANLPSYVPGIKKLPRFERQQMVAAVHTGGALGNSLLALFRKLRIEESGWHDAPNESELPMVAMVPGEGFQVVYGRGTAGDWLVDGPAGRCRRSEWVKGTKFAAAHAKPAQSKERSARAMFVHALRSESGWVAYSVIASLIASALALGTSFYSMQIYDRVIGTGAVPTLIVLTIGVLIAVLIELAIRVVRAGIIDRASSEIDHICSYGVFSRMLSVRLDQMPGGVGTLASQVRSYESIRTFGVNLTLFLTSDGPFSLFFLFVIFLLAGPVVASIPLLFMLLSVAVGMLFKSRIETATQGQVVSGNRRNGLLVEAIDGAESLKAMGAGWYLLGRWNELSRQNVSESMRIKHLNEMSSYLASTLQQISYIGLVAAGAWFAATSNSLTTGGIIACSILSGRALTPVGMIPGLIVQWAHARIALRQLEQIYALESENHDIETPLMPDAVGGNYALEDVKFVYQGQVAALSMDRLSIQTGEKVAIVGPIGSGKSTLLRLMAGLIKPQRGRILLDGLDIQQISADRRAELIGYLSQKSNLIGGTLKENLVMGLPPVTEGDLLAVCQETGLGSMIASRSEGLNLPIAEGGGGLSGGQMQLVAFTRLLLSRPSIWLLDEPTAAMDEASESKCISALRNTVQSDQTLVLVTHKVQMLGLVNRIVVMGPDGIVLDGPRDAVLARLRNPVPTSAVQSQAGSAATVARPD